MLYLENPNPTPLDRDLVEHRPGEPDRSTMQPWLRMIFPETRITWAQILEPGEDGTAPPPILFTAPSGSGKSTELHFLARQLRKEGKAAVAVEARRLAAGELEAALHDEELALWREWQAQQRDRRPVLYLLIDAVDELYLGRRNLNELSSAMRTNDLLGPELRIIVASRDDTWGPRETQWLRSVCRQLEQSRLAAPSPPVESSAPRSFEEVSDKQIARRALQNLTKTEDTDDRRDFRHIKLAFMNSEQVAQLSTHFGLAEADRNRFLDTLVAADIQSLFPLRPRDAGTLVGYWQAHGNLDSWTDILEWQVRNAFQELNPDRGRHRALSLERYTEGIRRIAAITTLSEARHVLRPDSATVKGAPHAEDLFPEWKPDELKELFASALLVRKGPASRDDSGVAVQIVQGELSNYLAAQWASGVYLGGAEDVVLKSLFVVPPEHEGECVPDGRRNVAGWLAGLLPEVRKRLLAVAPDVLLYRGDPACLSGDEVRETVQAMLQQDSVAHHEYGSQARLSRIARRELSNFVACALGDAHLRDRLAYELLEICKRGAFQEAVEPALEWARNDTAEEYTRKRAIELVGQLGAEHQKEQLLQLVATDAPPVRIALFRALVPQHLSGDRLVDFLARENKGDISYEIEKRGLPLTPLELSDLARRLNSRLRKASKKKPSESAYDEAEDGTAQLAVEILRLRSTDPRPLESEFCELLISLECHELRIYVDAKQKKAVWEALTEHHWESIWEARIKHEPVWDQQLFLCPIISSKFDWVVEKLALLGDGPAHAHLRTCAEKFIDSLSAADLEELKSRISPESLRFADRREQVAASEQVDRQQYKAEQEQEKADKRAENDAALRPHLAKIREGDHEGALDWAYPYFPETSFSHRRDLLEVVSADVADALTEGFRNWWRKSSPSPNSTETTYGESWGLLGLSLEIGEKGFSAIRSDEEFRIATLLALRELNSVPNWLKDLHALRPGVVERTIRATLAAAWTSKSGRTSFISHLYLMDAPELIEVVSKEAFLLLATLVPESAETLENAFDLILRVSNPPDWLTQVAAHWTAEATGKELRKQWLRLWCHSDGEAAARWLRQERKRDPSWDAVVLDVCQKIEWDLDRDRPAKWSTFFSTASLRNWLPLLVDLAPPQKEFRELGRGKLAHAWTPVDHTREVLDAAQRKLVADGSFEGSTSMKELATHSDARVSSWAQRMVPFQRANAVAWAQETWDVEKVLEAERFARRVPLTTAELCDVILGEIARIDHRMREGDFSYPEFFTDKLTENDIQRWVAAQLELVGKRTFYVGREGEVKDGNKMDIVAIRPSLGRVPIEIKPIFTRKKYSLQDLKNTLDDQLVGKYMRPENVTHGILLLVRLVPKRWNSAGRSLTFAEGIQHLTSHALTHRRCGKSVSVAVLDIDAARAKKLTTNKP